MIRNMDFNIAAIVLLLFIYIFFKLKYKSNTYNGKYFRLLIAFIMMSAAMNIISDYLLTLKGTISDTVLYVVYSLYLLMVVGCPYLLVEYSRALVTQSRKISFIDFINQMIVLVHIILCILTVFNHVYIVITPKGLVERGGLYIVVYLISGYYLIFSMLRVLLHFSSTNNKHVYAISGFVVLSFSGALCQYFFFEDTMAIYFIYAMAVLILLFSFETPDFEELIRTTKELEESRNELRTIQEREQELTATVHQLTKIASWVIYFDEEGQVKEALWSPEFLEMMGYAEGEYTGDISSLWTDSLHPDDRDEVVSAFMGGIQGAPYREVQTRLIDRYGQARWYVCSGELKKDENGRIKSYQGFVRDIDDEKARQILNEEKIRMLEELERSQEELKKALFDAEEANRAKTMFLSNMSHDIRTPMNAIVGYTQLAQEHMDDLDEIKDCLATIRSSGEHLLSLINDVLDMSRIESGKVKVEAVPCDLRKIMDDLQNMTRANVDERRQSYVSDCSRIMESYVMCDRLRLSQILINCIGNAVKYTPEGGSIAVSVKQEASKEAGYANYIFYIKDNGIGMTPEFLARVFEPFERDKSSRVGQIQGTGLGMAITKNLVEMMNGEISATSEVGKGTEFFIKIPLKIVSEKVVVEYGSECNESVSVEEMINALKGKRFLVVDDNKLNRGIVKRLLEPRGMLIEECASGEEAIKRLNDAGDGEFDMVFMDIQMPIMNGYETTDIIRSSGREYLRGVTIIAMTANAFEEDKRQAKEHGMNGHVTKPFKLNELIRMLYSQI